MTSMASGSASSSRGVSVDPTTAATTTSSPDTHGPPSLGYSLREPKRRRNIAIFWSMVVVDSVAMPLALYFALWYHTDLSPNTVFSIVTAALGGVSIADYGWRLWRLWKKNSDCRVEGVGRYHLDFFHWCFTFMWMVLMIELIVGTIPENPPIRLLSMPLASCLYVFGIILLTLDAFRFLAYPAPFKISSQTSRTVPFPAIYFVIEDVVAVDGYGGTEYRSRLRRRYEASEGFRVMLRVLSVFWWTGALATAVITTVLVFTLPKDAAFVVGWTVPFFWAGLWAGATMVYVRRTLVVERVGWPGQADVRTIGEAKAGV